MTLHHIKVFCTVCDEGSMSNAAKRLNMTQPGVSKIIADLEGYYRIVLFVRKNRKLYLTASGKQLYQDSKKVIQAFNRLETNARHDSGASSIILGCTAGIGFSVVAEIQELFKAKYPNCQLFLRDNSSKHIQDMVLSGECNLAMVQTSPANPLLYQFPFCRNSLVAVCSPSYKLESTSNVLSIEELANEKLILLERERTTRTLIDKAANEFGITLNPTWTSSSPSNVRDLAARGEGVAILFELQVKKDIHDGKLRIVPTDLNIKTDFYIIYRKDIWLTEEEQYLVELCHQVEP